MPRKHYEYKHIENVNTLRLTLDFGKLYPTDIVEEGYYVLSTKGRKKSEYIVKAYEHFKNCKDINTDIKKSLQWLRIAQMAKERFDLDTEEKIERTISMEPGSREYELIEASVPKQTKPTKMLCGFKMTDEQAANTHTELYDMSANERVLTVSKAVVNYVLDGFDLEMEDIFVTRFVLDTINSYHKSQNKEKILNDFKNVLKLV